MKVFISFLFLVSLIFSANIFAQACDNLKTNQTYDGEGFKGVLYGKEKGFEFTVNESRGYDSKMVTVTRVVDLELDEVNTIKSAPDGTLIKCLGHMKSFCLEDLDQFNLMLNKVIIQDVAKPEAVSLIDCFKEIIRNYKITLSK
ncbi:MAG: hypothetical protein V1647_06795 [Pseudomonadota bacterium]